LFFTFTKPNITQKRNNVIKSVGKTELSNFLSI
jgi:hypothetical protein